VAGRAVVLLGDTIAPRRIFDVPADQSPTNFIWADGGWDRVGKFCCGCGVEGSFG